jgi:hypothetical protein
MLSLVKLPAQPVDNPAGAGREIAFLRQANPPESPGESLNESVRGKTLIHAFIRALFI